MFEWGEHPFLTPPNRGHGSWCNRYSSWQGCLFFQFCNAVGLGIWHCMCTVWLYRHFVLLCTYCAFASICLILFTLARNLPQWAILPHHGRAMVECACMEWWWLPVASPADSDQLEGRSCFITLPILSSKYSCNIPTHFMYMYIHIHCTCTWTHNYAITFSWNSIVSLPLGSVFPRGLGTGPYNSVGYVFRYMHVSILSWYTHTPPIGHSLKCFYTSSLSKWSLPYGNPR